MSAIKFLTHYTKEDKNIFFGRKKETEELFLKARRSRLTLLYGLSGTGKTSLVQCGLANRFNESDWFELYVRRRGKNLLQSLREQIFLNALTPIRPGVSHLKGLESLYLDYFRPIYIIFDQFEELFISGKPDETDSFIDFLYDLLNSAHLHINVILVMREEYLAYLDQFEKMIPNILENRMRLEVMSQPALRILIGEILEVEGIGLVPGEATAAEIIDNLKDKKGVVELPYLQVYLSRLSRQIEGGKVLHQSQVRKVGTLGDVLSDYLDEQVGQIAFSEEDKELVWQVLKSLTTLEGTKKTLTVNELIHLITYG